MLAGAVIAPVYGALGTTPEVLTEPTVDLVF